MLRHGLVGVTQSATLDDDLVDQLERARYTFTVREGELFVVEGASFAANRDNSIYCIDFKISKRRIVLVV